MRRLDRSDARPYREFRLAALALNPAAFTSTAAEERLRPLEWFETRIRPPSAPDDFILGAFSGERLVGTAGFARSAPDQARHKGVLFGMAVAPEVGGRGVGRLLVEALLSELRALEGMRQVVLTYTEGNVAAARLYRACGFRTFGREICAVVVGEAEVTKIHMVRVLAEEVVRPAYTLDGMRMVATSTDQRGSVGAGDPLLLEEAGNVVSARYRGGAIVDGFLIGQRAGDRLVFRYVQAGRDGRLDAGISEASLETLADGRLRMTERFIWLTRSGEGVNVFEEERGA